MSAELTLEERTCPECKDSVPPGWTLDDHFNCVYAEDFEYFVKYMEGK